MKVNIYSNGLTGCLIGIFLTVGLLNLVLLLGYGMVNIPMKCFKRASLTGRLNYLQYYVAEYTEKLEKKCAKVKEVIKVILYPKIF